MNDQFTPSAIVIDAGDFPSSPHALHWLNECDKIVCCDGAANSFIATGKEPWRIVGDCDSLAEELKIKYADRLCHISEQESNDQTKAVRYLAARGYNTIAILGATGKREDHTLGNISLLIDYLKHGVRARIYTDYGVFIPVHNYLQLTTGTGRQISIFNFGATGLTAAGLRYPLRDFDSWWQGTLNETSARSFSIRAHGYFLVFVNYP